MFNPLKSKANIFEEDHVCPWWMAYSFDNPIRKLFHQPQHILGPFLKKDMTVMDIGCGMGFFSIAMAKLVGNGGRVFAVDLQEKMLNITMKRAGGAGVAQIIRPHRCRHDDLGLKVQADFILVFWMVHEVTDRVHFFQQLRSNLTDRGKIFVAEPKLHVSATSFEKIISAAGQAGLLVDSNPTVRFSHSAVLIPSRAQTGNRAVYK